MKYLSCIALLLFSSFTFSRAEWQCKPTGSLLEYQAVVAYAKYFAQTEGVSYLRNVLTEKGFEIPENLTGEGFSAEEVAWLSYGSYAEKPDALVLKMLRDDKCGKSFAYGDSAGKGLIPHFKKMRRVNELKGISTTFYKENYERSSVFAHAYGVPFSVVVSILGMETNLGTVRLRHSIIHTHLTQLYFYGSKGRDEDFNPLTELMAALWMKRSGYALDEDAFKGSYAGALGMPQFLPSSVLKFAQDGDSDGHIDLYHSLPDVVASVAHYLKVHGWDNEQQWCQNIELSSSDLQRIRLDGDHFKWGFSYNLVQTKEGWRDYFQMDKKSKMSAMDIPELNEKQGEYYSLLVLRDAHKGVYQGCLVGDNIRAIWFYNHSILGYAAPVLTLSDYIASTSRLEGRQSEDLRKASQNTRGVDIVDIHVL